MVNRFYQTVLIPGKSHDVIYTCSTGLAMSGGDGIDSILECVLSGERGLLLLRPIVPGA
jgi:hypothetical protein